MRIRKNKNLTAMGYEGFHAAYHCLLNQSPWDCSDNSDGNWVSVVGSSARLETREGGDEMAAGVTDAAKQKESGGSDTEMDQKGKLIRFKKSEDKCVQCQKMEWSEGYDHCCCVAICSAKSHEKRLHRSQRKRRPTDATKSNSRTNGFYYYSGFGPSWAKKRGHY